MAQFNFGASVSDSFKQKSMADLNGAFPGTMSKIIGSVNMGREANFKVPAMSRGSALFAAQTDSMTPQARSYWDMQAQGGTKPLVRFEPDTAVVAETNHIIDSFIKEGKSMDDARSLVKARVEPVMQWDSVEKQYVVRTHMKGVNDSIISNSSIPYWNIGILYKVFKQPYAPSKASRLVSIESFGNAWCDTCMVFKEAFEGYGRISSVARGNAEMTASDPVLNKFGTIMSQIYNISVEYESSIAEGIAASSSGSPLITQGIADREQYARMVIQRIRDQLIYFGDTDSGFVGLSQLCTPETYSGTPLNSIYTGASTTKGSDIVKAFIGKIADFMQANHYMSKELKINVSTFTYKALTSTVYSDQFNPESPLETITKHFASGNDLGGGLKKLAVTFEVDPMLDPTITGGITNPFNLHDYDLTFFTVPSVSSAMGDQQGLIIMPEPLSTFIVPPMYSRQGMLYTMYSRVGGLIAPISGTVACIQGLGYQTPVTPST